MVTASGDRSEHFPAIEKKHGEKIDVWIRRLRDLGDAKYAEQIAFLRENHGFSQAHANALVMHVRGSLSARRFRTPAEYWKSVDPAGAKTGRAIMDSLLKRHRDLSLVIAWNHPILRSEAGYVLGVSVAKNHVTINPFSDVALQKVASRLKGYEVNKKTFQVPFGWKPDEALLDALVAARRTELGR